MSPYAKFGLDWPSRSAGHRHQTNRQINIIAFYYAEVTKHAISNLCFIVYMQSRTLYTTKKLNMAS